MDLDTVIDSREQVTVVRTRTCHTRERVLERRASYNYFGRRAGEDSQSSQRKENCMVEHLPGVAGYQGELCYDTACMLFRLGIMHPPGPRPFPQLSYHAPLGLGLRDLTPLWQVVPPPTRHCIAVEERDQRTIKVPLEIWLSCNVALGVVPPFSLQAQLVQVAVE